MSIELRIKSKHLALEPAIIRNEERKLKKQIAWAKKHGEEYSSLEVKRESLSDHRRKDVRNEARATFLARAFLAGKPYSSIEPRRHNDYEFTTLIVPRIVAMVKKYGSPDTTHNQIWSWINMRAA